MRRLDGKRMLVTGAGRGIGKAVAERFLQEGARVLICDRVADRLDRTREELNPLGEIHALVGDVNDTAFCDELVRNAKQRQGGLDGLVNNAGVSLFRPFLEHSEEDWDHTLNVNLRAVFLLSRRVAKLMVEEGTGGTMINMASTNAHFGEKHLAAYNASKGGLLLLTKTMAVELAPYGIRVNCVSPGLINTELVAEASGSESFLQAYISKIPLGRSGEPADVANLCVFLASEEASFITGESIIIDGGQTVAQ